MDSRPLKDRLKKVLPYWVYSPARDVYRYVASFAYWGTKYECPFCSGHFNEFLPGGYDVPVLKEKQVIGGGRRSNAICPRCFSDDRERQVYLYLMREKQELFTKEIRVLHVAPEKNLARTLRSKTNIDYLAIDLDSPLADIRMDITDISLASDTYDVIICNAVLEHVADDKKAMRELHRVLKSGGFAVLQVPLSPLIEKTIENPAITSPEERERVYGQRNHVRLYGKDYVNRLRDAGFKVEIIDCRAQYASSEYSRYSLIDDEQLFICSK